MVSDRSTKVQVLDKISEELFDEFRIDSIIEFPIVIA